MATRADINTMSDQPRTGIPTGPAALITTGLLGAVGGAIVGTIEEYLTAASILPAEYYWSTVLSGVALVLGMCWVMLALRNLENPRWLTGSVVAGGLGLVSALIGAYVTTLGIEVKYSFMVVAAVPALAAGLMLAYAFGRISRRVLLMYLVAGAVWLVIGWAFATMLQGQPTPNNVPLPDSFLLWVGEIVWFLSVPTMLAWPLLAVAFSRRGSRVGKSFIWLTAGTVLLPLIVAGFFGLALRLIPD